MNNERKSWADSTDPVYHIIGVERWTICTINSRRDARATIGNAAQICHNSYPLLEKGGRIKVGILSIQNIISGILAHSNEAIVAKEST